MTVTTPTQKAATAKAPERTTAEDPINALIYGVSGAGKTRLALSAADVPEMRPVFVFDVERGMLGIRASEHWSRVAVNGPEEFYANLGRLQPYRTIVLDSLTMLVQNTLTAIVMQRSGGAYAEPEQRDYGKLLFVMQDILSKLRATEKHVILICSQKFDYHDQVRGQAKQIRELLPMIVGASQDRAQNIADFIWPLTVADEKRYLLTRPRGLYRVKSRLLLSEGIDEKGIMTDPTMAKIHRSFQKAL